MTKTLLRNKTLAIECEKIEVENSKYLLLPASLYSLKEYFNSDCFYLDEDINSSSPDDLLSKLKKNNEDINLNDIDYIKDRFYLHCLNNTDYDLYKFLQIKDELEVVIDLIKEIDSEVSIHFSRYEKETLPNLFYKHFLDNISLDVLSELTLFKYHFAHLKSPEIYQKSIVCEAQEILNKFLEDKLHVFNRNLDFSLYIRTKNSDINKKVKLYSSVNYLNIKDI
jgi:hypothetical protein